MRRPRRDGTETIVKYHRARVSAYDAAFIRKALSLLPDLGYEQCVWSSCRATHY